MGEIVDYNFLIATLGRYANPRDKIHRMVDAGELIRAKKGLYVSKGSLGGGFVKLEVLANMIYGPSYVSFEYALSWYGLIPERVNLVTSATTGRTREFRSSLGRFHYQHLSLDRYQIGLLYTGEFFIASKEKALCDSLGKISPFSGERQLWDYLIEGFRIDEDDLMGLDRQLIQKIALKYGNQNVRLLLKALGSL